MDTSEWELSKENVQPIKQGRKIPNLTAALTPCGVSVGDDSLYWKLQKDKQNFEAEIRTYEGDDFLDIWYRYILWTEENVPKGGRETSTLLERCIKEFQDVSKYENDERYLNVWLKYADCCSDPLEIFNYLHAKGTCSRLALFYIAWSSACENVENFQKADQVLTLGIEKSAQPLDILQKHHVGFQHRLAARIAASEDKPSGYGEENQRKVLGSLAKTGRKMAGVLRTSSHQNPLQSRSGQAKPEKKGLGFSILHDSDDSENRMSRLPEERGNEWKEAPVEAVMSKENVNMPGKWTGEHASSRRPPSTATSVIRPAPKQSFQVHVDEDAEQTGHVGQTVGGQVLSVRKSDLEASNNPLKVLSSSAENSGPPTEKVMYDKSKVYAGNEEFQFEEIRAAKYMAMVKQGLPLPKDVNRLKREKNRVEKVEKKERVMYPKDKVYAYEGEFQLEEVMANLYYERGNRLRMPKRTKYTEVPVADLPCTAADADVSDLHQPIENLHQPIENLHQPHTDDAPHIKKSLSLSNVEDFRVVNDDTKNIPTPHSGVNHGSRGMTVSNDARKGSLGSSEVSSKENFPRHDVGNDSAVPDAAVQLRKPILSERREISEKKSDVITPRFARYKSDLTGPSPTLTTKQAFADVMPWFNTTVGLNTTSDDELENDFKNDENDDEPDAMGWCGIPFGDDLEMKKQTDCKTNDVDDYFDENQENLPPFGYSQTKIERPVLGILQPSVGIPFKPLEDFDEDEEKMDTEVVKKVLTDQVSTMKQEGRHTEEEITNHNGLNHSEFAAAARFVSTPFVENLNPPMLETLHCSSIEAYEGRQCDVSENSSNVSSSSYNANSSKVLSPILECSDEDAKTASSKGSSHSSGVFTKSNVQTTQSVSTCQAGGVFEDSFTSCASKFQNRSLDITVHDMNGSVLKKINPFDPNLCNKLLTKLPHPVSSFLGYHDLRGGENGLPKFAVNKTVVLDGDTFKISGAAGSGAYAKVFVATKGGSTSYDSSAVALKVQHPANDWEFYICRELLKRMKNRGKSESEISSIVDISDYHAFLDGSCAVSKYHQLGTFLDFVNRRKQMHYITEETSLFYGLEMLNILESIHDCGIIHGDIKPDNFVLLQDTEGDGQHCHLGLIDFGCAIDVELFPSGTRFSVDKNTESFECIEMKTQRPWTTQVDTYGMLCSLHCLIFGEYMKVYQERTTGRWKITKSFNRTWKKSMWNKFFDVFLNIPSCDQLPSLATFRQEFQEHLRYLKMM